jgi:hypothetical protein
MKGLIFWKHPLKYRNIDKTALMKNNQTTLNRKDIVDNALGSLRVEGMKPSNELMKDFDAFIGGSKTIDQIIAETKERYVALRRE